VGFSLDYLTGGEKSLIIFIYYKKSLTKFIMNKHYLMSKFKSTGVAYLLWFFFGSHYAYLGMWRIQILFWIALIIGVFTFGTFWFLSLLWGFIDLFLIPGKVNKYNMRISAEIESIEKKEKDEEFQRNLAISQMGKNPSVI
jgi:hypothetical protein